MNARTDRKHRSALVHKLRGPALLVLAPLQFLLGNSLLERQPLLKQVTVLGSIGLLLVMTSTLVLMAGLGETIAVLEETLHKSR